MSIENANRFLEAITDHEELRVKFEGVQNTEEFTQAVHQLGYNFTLEELMAIAKEHSEGVVVRRRTGVWKWLRQTGLNWANQH